MRPIRFAFIGALVIAILLTSQFVAASIGSRRLASDAGNAPISTLSSALTPGSTQTPAPTSISPVIAPDAVNFPSATATPTPTPALISATFVDPAPGDTIALTVPDATIRWSEIGAISDRSLTEQSGPPASDASCVGIPWTTVWTTVVNSSPQAVHDLAVGSCYRFSLVLNGDDATTATSGDLVVISPTAAANPAKLTTSYVLTSRMSYAAGRVDTVETVTVTNDSAAYFTILNLSAIPRALGYLKLTGPVQIGTTEVAADWTNHTNLAISLPPLAPGATASITLPFRLVVGSSTGAFGSRTSKTGGILNLGEWFPIVSRVHDAYGLGDPQVTWNADSITLDLTLTDGARARDAVAASGDLVTAPASSGTHWKFVAKNVRDFAVSVSPSYHLYKATVGATTIKAYATTNTKGTTLLATTKAAFIKYNAVYGTYPYKSFSIAQVGASGFSMEFPTMVLMGANMVTSAYAIWHEVAHQWFYGLLGDDQISEPWLDEAWADFSSYYFLGLSFTYCSTKDINRSTLSWPAGLTTGSWFACNGYFETVYHRGRTFINTLRKDMGTSAFFAAIRSYIALHRYGNVTGADELHYLDGKTSYDLWGGPVHKYTSYN